MCIYNTILKSFSENSNIWVSGSLLLMAVFSLENRSHFSASLWMASFLLYAGHCLFKKTVQLQWGGFWAFPEWAPLSLSGI